MDEWMNTTKPYRLGNNKMGLAPLKKADNMTETTNFN
ncbi:MAG: hypothetical protein ACI9PC_001573, partial [Porticoccaceae bacterium]